MKTRAGLSNVSTSVTNLKDLSIELPYSFSLSQTLNCGQCFRWREYRDTNGTDSYCGIVENNCVFISQLDMKTFIFYNTDLTSFNELWKAYFDLERDYELIKSVLTRDAVLSKAVEFCGGIRVLRQPKWETLCSYIISQNNNIPRIKSLIEKMCASFGDLIKTVKPDGTSGEVYSFPQPAVLAKLNASDLERLGFGYRAPYVVRAAEAVANGDINLDAVTEMPIDEARAELRKLTGVGPKVAECALLYGFGKEEAFPVDTWIKKVMSEFYPAGLPEYAKPHAGIAQIYLFHYVRNRE